jgi:hypothetical protein
VAILDHRDLVCVAEGDGQHLPALGDRARAGGRREPPDIGQHCGRDLRVQ